MYYSGHDPRVPACLNAEGGTFSNSPRSCSSPPPPRTSCSSPPPARLFRTAEGRSALVKDLDALVQSAGPLGPVLFVLIYTIGVLFLPATPFTIAGAVIFGKFHGMLYNLAADVLGASISFYLGRYFLHGVARGFLETRMPWLDRKAEEEGFTVIFYLRIFWFPFIVLNYAAGATRIRFRDYLLGTMLGLLPPVFIFTYFIGAMRDVLARTGGPRTC